jgi:hypothetical protein
MTDYRKRYKTQYAGEGKYGVVEELSGDLVVANILTYGEAQDDADRRNSELALERATAK